MWLGDGFIIAVQRNAIVPLGFELADESDGEPISVLGYSIEMRVAKAQGETSIIDIPCVIDDSLRGYFSINIDGRAFGSVAATKETVMLAFDLVATDPSGPIIIARGTLQLEPGIPA